MLHRGGAAVSSGDIKSGDVLHFVDGAGVHDKSEAEVSYLCVECVCYACVCKGQERKGGWEREGMRVCVYACAHTHACIFLSLCLLYLSLACLP